jgi:hypothetical protein
MFTAWCDESKAEVLLTSRDVLGMRNTEGGVLVAYRCWCGAHGVLLTGAGAAAERSGHVPPVREPVAVG